MEGYTKEQIKESIAWLYRKKLQNQEEIDKFDKGKNPIMENYYIKKIREIDKIIKEMRASLNNPKSTTIKTME